MKYESIIYQSLGILCADGSNQSNHVLLIHSTEMNRSQNLRAAECFTQLPHLSNGPKGSSARRARRSRQERCIEVYDAVSGQLTCFRSPETTSRKKHVTFCPVIFERMITPESSEDFLQFIDTRPLIKEYSSKRHAERPAQKRSRKKLCSSPSNHVKEHRTKEGLRPTHRQNKEIISLIEKVSFTSSDLANRRERILSLRPSSPLKRQMMQDRYAPPPDMYRSRSRNRESPNRHEVSSDFEIHGKLTPSRRRLRRISLSPEGKRHMPKSRSSRAFSIGRN